MALAACVVLATQATSVADELKRFDGHKPSFTLHDLNGSRVSLQDVVGRTVLVHFFATWCEPCRDELPALARLQQRTPGTAVLAISVAENGLRVGRFFQHMPVGFPVLLDTDRAVARSWDITTLPTTYVLDARLLPQRIVEADYPWDDVDIAPDGQLTIHASDKTRPTTQ
jgi:thiol-disulfide isomerase/thioredoxin